MTELYAVPETGDTVTRFKSGRFAVGICNISGKVLTVVIRKLPEFRLLYGIDFFADDAVIFVEFTEFLAATRE